MGISAYQRMENAGCLDDYQRLEEINAALLDAAEKAVAYDDAIRGCANDPRKMASFCTAEGDTLDALYDAWISAARDAIKKAKEFT